MKNILIGVASSGRYVGVTNCGAYFASNRDCLREEANIVKGVILADNSFVHIDSKEQNEVLADRLLSMDLFVVDYIDILEKFEIGTSKGLVVKVVGFDIPFSDKEKLISSGEYLETSGYKKEAKCFKICFTEELQVTVM